ncbi:MAG: TIGR02186 family protein [Alphaproteobacteria bacterium]|nr:TIGR02186 family protein [Alphaproteobacteria bacterium]
MRWLLALLLLSLPAVAEEPLVARLSTDRVELSTTFTGGSLMVFGSTAQPIGPGGAEVIIMARGPDLPFTVRRKVQVLGLWFNGPAARYGAVPAFYAVAGTLPAWRLLPEALRRQYALGLDMLRLTPTGARDPEFRAALVEIKQEAGLWQEDIAPVDIVGGRLFHVNLPLPATIPAGDYTVEVLLVDSRRVAARELLAFRVERVGTAATIADVSRGQPLLYGVICVVLAILAGWLGSMLFRRN